MNRILIWGNGKSHPNSVYNSKQPKTVQELPSKKEISKVYTKDDAFIYIVEGEVYKEGELAFEKDKKELDQPKQLFREHIKLYKGKVEMKFPVEDLSIGENHIIIRTTNDNVFTWGDNYYGQLGIDNFMINKMLSPQFVRLSNIKQIHAYKNNSFAIDGNSKLWVWGKYEYLGINLKSNLFKPLQILNHYNLTFFKVNDNRIICAVNQNNKDTMKDEIINNKKQDEVDESRQESRMNLPSAKSLNDSKRASTKNLGKKKTKKNQVSELILYALDTLSKNIEEYYNENPIQDGKKICYLSELKKKMLNLRKNLLM